MNKAPYPGFPIPKLRQGGGLIFYGIPNNDYIY